MFCGRKNSNKIEKLQERALRFVFNDPNSTYNDLLKRGNFLSLSALRLRFLAIEMYKCRNNMAPSYRCDLFRQNIISYNLRDSDKLIQPDFKTKTFGYRSFTYYGSKIWNSLPTEIKASKTLSTFKIQINEWCHSADCDRLIID